MVKIVYLLTLNTRGMETACEHLEDIPVDQKKWQAFKNHSTQAYMRYQTLKKSTSDAHGYGSVENHA